MYVCTYNICTYKCNGSGLEDHHESPLLRPWTLWCVVFVVRLGWIVGSRAGRSAWKCWVHRLLECSLKKWPKGMSEVYLTQRVNLDCQYGIRAQKPAMDFGP